MERLRAGGLVLLQSGGERAKEWINRALLIDPDNITCYNFACGLALTGRAKTALQLLGPVSRYLRAC